MGDAFVVRGLRLARGKFRSKRARAKEMKDEAAALGRLIAPIQNAFALADRFVEMCADMEQDDPVPDEALSHSLRRIVEVWGSGDVAPHVTDEAFHEAWRRADVAGLADRWDRSRAGTDLADVERNLSRKTGRALAGETVAIDVRIALNGFRDVILLKRGAGERT